MWRNVTIPESDPEEMVDLLKGEAKNQECLSDHCRLKLNKIVFHWSLKFSLCPTCVSCVINSIQSYVVYCLFDVLSPSFWVSRTTRYEGVSESERVVYDDTAIFSNLPVYYTQSTCVSTWLDRINVRTSYYYNITVRSILSRRDTRRPTPGTRTQHGNTKAEKDQTENVAHSNHRLIYPTATSRQPKDQNITGEVGSDTGVTYNGGLDPLVANDFNFI